MISVASIRSMALVDNTYYNVMVKNLCNPLPFHPVGLRLHRQLVLYLDNAICSGFQCVLNEPDNFGQPIEWDFSSLGE